MNRAGHCLGNLLYASRHVDGVFIHWSKLSCPHLSHPFFSNPTAHSEHTQPTDTRIATKKHRYGHCQRTRTFRHRTYGHRHRLHYPRSLARSLVQMHPVNSLCHSTDKRTHSQAIVCHFCVHFQGWTIIIQCISPGVWPCVFLEFTAFCLCLCWIVWTDCVTSIWICPCLLILKWQLFRQNKVGLLCLGFFSAKEALYGQNSSGLESSRCKLL